MNATLGTLGSIVITLGYTLGPFFGLYAAFENGSFFNACLSLVIPFYGCIYWLVT